MAGTKNQMNRFAKVDNDSYRQEGHPYAVTSCGRRRSYMHGPLKCWKTHKKVGMKDSPTYGASVQVNDCVKK